MLHFLRNKFWHRQALFELIIEFDYQSFTDIFILPKGGKEEFFATLCRFIKEEIARLSMFYVLRCYVVNNERHNDEARALEHYQNVKVFQQTHNSSTPPLPSDY